MVKTTLDMIASVRGMKDAALLAFNALYLFRASGIPGSSSFDSSEQ